MFCKLVFFKAIKKSTKVGDCQLVKYFSFRCCLCPARSCKRWLILSELHLASLPNDKKWTKPNCEKFAGGKRDVGHRTISVLNGGRKQMWERKKILVTSTVSFSHIVFKALFFIVGKNWNCVVFA